MPFQNCSVWSSDKTIFTTTEVILKDYVCINLAVKLKWGPKSGLGGKKMQFFQEILHVATKVFYEKEWSSVRPDMTIFFHCKISICHSILKHACFLYTALKQRYWKRLFRSAIFGRFRDVSGYP